MLDPPELDPPELDPGFALLVAAGTAEVEVGVETAVAPKLELPAAKLLEDFG